MLDPFSRSNQEQTHKNQIKNNLKNLETNPQTPTHGRNHTHFRNKPINHKNGFGLGWERWVGDQTIADGGDDGQRKSQRVWP